MPERLDGGEGSVSMQETSLVVRRDIMIMTDLFFATYGELVLLTKAMMENAWFPTMWYYI